jgi:hypothetical protein
MVFGDFPLLFRRLPRDTEENCEMCQPGYLLSRPQFEQGAS